MRRMYIATPVDCVRAALEMSREMFTAAFYAVFIANEAQRLFLTNEIRTPKPARLNAVAL